MGSFTNDFVLALGENGVVDIGNDEVGQGARCHVSTNYHKQRSVKD